MAKDSLMVEISPALQEAMGIQTANRGVDYFQLLGVGRDFDSPGLVDQGIMERSRVLRKWQSSPQYGPEVIKLLSMLHRAGKILKDALRCQAYREQIDRMERGDETNAQVEFVNLVRAAMADNMMDAATRRELTRFASERGVSPAEAQRIVAQVREELKAIKAAEAEAAPKDDGWEFRIAEQGEPGFMMMLDGIEASEKFTDQTPAQMLGQAAKFGITPDRAAQIIAEFQRCRFQRMIKRVAGGGVVSDAQVRLLLPKAASYGLDQRQAYEIIADYTLSAQSTDDALRNLALNETFNNEEIATIVNNANTGPRRRSGFSLGNLLPDWLRNVVLIGLAVGAIIFAALWIKSNFLTPSHNGVITEPSPPSLGAPSPLAQNATNPTAVPDEAAPPPAPPAGPRDTNVPLVAKADPPSGVLLFKPERPGDPPAFEMAITEVTCAQYQQFLETQLDAPPPGWNGRQCPAGSEQLPVTNLPWRKAMAYCKWLATQKGWTPQSVMLPSYAEFRRAARGRTPRGQTSMPRFWSRARLEQVGQVTPVKQNQLDHIFFIGAGQMYDLIGNVAEWGRDEQGAQHSLLGGDYTQTSPDFDPFARQWIASDTIKPSIGFRFVHQLAK